MKKLFTLIIFVALVAFANNTNAQNAFTDPGFEAGAGSGAWVEASTNFGTPICDYADCGDCGGPCVSHTGSFYVWFGGVSAAETGTVTQTVHFTPTSTELKFWFKIGLAASNANQDIFTVSIDGNVVFTAANGDSTTYASYVEETVDVTTYADGANHTVEFKCVQTGTPGVSNYLLDDISLAGNAGLSQYLLEGISIYPNPTTDKVNIKFNRDNAEDQTVIIFNVLGEKVYENSNIESDLLNIDVTGFESGNYYLRVFDSKGNEIVEKITKQ